MEFEMKRASREWSTKDDPKEYVEINSLEDLEKLQKDLKTEMDKDPWTKERFYGELIIDFINKTITFYDYWIE